jgi:hypothetical protein
MSKTIKQIADELEVSKTAIRKKMTVLFTDNTGNQFAETVSGVIYITDFGENLIKQSFTGTREKQVSGEFSETKSCVSGNQPETKSSEVFNFDVVIDTLKKQLEQKDIQIAEKDKQIAEKDKQIDQIQQALLQQQKLHQTDQIKTLKLTDGNKKHWWNFKKNKESV